MQTLRQIMVVLHEMLFHLRWSPIYVTPPIGGPSQPPYWNLVVSGTTSLTPWALFRRLKTLERKVGRLRHKRWGPRVMDLDLLFYDQMIVHTPDLQIPHPRVHERPFVLIPMRDLDPHWRHPVLKKTVEELLAEVPEIPNFPKVSVQWFTGRNFAFYN